MRSGSTTHHLPYFMQSRQTRLALETQYANHYHTGYLGEYLKWYDSQYKIFKSILRAVGVPEPAEIEAYRTELKCRSKN
ncbi:MAG: hypothetical protein WC613_05515 [Candidatus Aenigmatarchaeota archaeon]